MNTKKKAMSSSRSVRTQKFITHKTFLNADRSLRVRAARGEDGCYALIIEKITGIASVGRNKRVLNSLYVKTFNTAEQANRYYKGIVKRNPTLVAAQ